MARPRSAPLPERDREDRGGGERGERERRDVVDEADERRPSHAPVDDRGREREQQRRAEAEDRRARERADRADGDRALEGRELERERLSSRDERDHGDEPEIVRTGAEEQSAEPRTDADGADRGDEQAQRRHAMVVGLLGAALRPSRASVGAGVTTAACGASPAAAIAGGSGHGGKRLALPVPVASRRGQLDHRVREVGRHLGVLGVRGDDAVAATDLRPVDGDVGRVDELLLVRSVLRERRHAHRDRGADRAARRVRLEHLLGHLPADALGDREGGLPVGLRQQERELLPTEPARHVVLAQLGAHDVGDPLDDGVAGEMAVGVVDLAQQVEVGHDQRQRPVEPVGPRRAPP